MRSGDPLAYIPSHLIEDSDTDELTTDRLLVPDGDGGVEWLNPGAAGLQTFPYVFRSGNNQYVEVNSATYVAIATVRFSGTLVLGTLGAVVAVLEQPAASDVDCRLYDITSALTIAEVTGTSGAGPYIQALTIISANVPAGAALFEWQIRGSGGGGGNRRARIYSGDIEG